MANPVGEMGALPGLGQPGELVLAQPYLAPGAGGPPARYYFTAALLYAAGAGAGAVFAAGASGGVLYGGGVARGQLTTE